MNTEIKDQEMNRPASALSARRGEYGRTLGEANFGKDESHVVGSRRWEFGRTMEKEEIDSQKKVVAKLGATSPSLIRRRSSSTAEEASFPSSSSALSEYVEELRRKRATEKQPGTLGLEDTSLLPIYQTTGASSLRRCRTFKDDDEFPRMFGVTEHTDSDRVPAGLVRSSSLKCISFQNTEPARSPALKRMSKFGSCDSLLLNMDNTYLTPSSPAVGADTFNSSRLKPWRSYLEPSLEDAANVDLGKDALVFESKQFGDVPYEGKGSDPFTWKIPTLNYERRTNVDFDDFLPAIRKSQSTSSLSRPIKDRREGQRPMSVHFEDQITADSTVLSKIKTISKAKEDPGNLSDSSSSSGSIVSFKSADSIKSRPKIQRPEGEGCAGKLITEGAKDERRWEAEGKEDDVNNIMMKYLGKD